MYKVSVSNVFTLIASGSVNPESITGGTTVDQYYTSIAVPQTALLSTDRLAIRVYVIVSGKNITLHTENSNFSEVITTFSTGLNSLNGLSDQVQYFAVGTSGTDFAISSSLDTHTFNLPTASATNRGALSSADWTTFNSKEPALTKGNLTEATSAVLTITGGTGAVIGTGTTIQVAQSGVSTSGFLSSTDWNTFNGKQNAITLTTTGSTGAATLIGATLNIPNYADQFVGTVTSVNMSVPTGFAISGNPITTSGTLAVAFAAGYSLPTDASQATWNTAYNDSITAFAYNTSTGALTLTQQDAGTLTATVTLQPFTTSNLVEGTNLYYTDTRARLALSAGTGISYDNATGVITNNDRGSSQNIFKNFAVAGQSTIVADSNDDTLTIVAGSGVTLTTNNTTDTLTISASGSGGTVTSVAALTIGTTGTDLSSTVVNGTTTPVITLQVPTASAANRGALSSTDWTTFNSKVGGSGTTNYVAKFTAGSTIGDSQIFDNGTNVGIGEPTPTAKLHVNGGAKFAGDINLGYGSASEYQVTIGQGRTGDGFAYIDLVGDTTYSDYGLRIIRGNGGANTTSTIVSRGTGEFQIRTEDNAPIVFYTSATDRGRITGAGNFGINEANPTQKLHISGNLRVTGAYYDSSNSAGSSAQVLSSTGSGTQWVNANAGTVTSVGLTAGTGITVSGGPITSSGSITVTNDDRGSSQNIFKNIAVTGQSDIVADTNNDTLTVAAGTGISITTNSTTDTLTITNTAASLEPKTESINIRATVPYTVVTPFDDVVIDTVDVKRNAPNTVTSTSKLLAIVTLEVNNTGSTGFTGFTLRLFNQTTSAAVTNTTTKWSAYMYPAATEFGFTSFTYHIPIDDTSIAVSDPIQLQLQLEVGTCDISIANFTLMSISK